MAIATISFGYAQTGQDMQQQGMTSIEMEKLPNEIQSTLESEQFSDWQIEQAYEVQEGEGDYAVKVKRGEETKILHFSEDGNLVKQEDVEMSPGQN